MVKHSRALQQLDRINISKTQRQIMAVAAECVEEFGGAEGFARELQSLYQSARSEPGGTRIAFKVLAAQLEFIKCAIAQRESLAELELAELSDAVDAELDVTRYG